jgi:tellurite methyltransferase
MSEPITPQQYHERAMQLPLHQLYSVLDRYLPESGEALELGCGVGHGVLHLVEKGFHVTAVDAEEEAVELLRSRLPDGSPARLVRSKFQELEMDLYDVVVGQFCLFYLTPAEFDAFWPKVAGSIKQGGLFAGQFLGEDDDWREKGYATHNLSQVEELFVDFEMLHFDEEREVRDDIWGRPKYWHVFHVVARKRI